jgi:hypothetical protein
MDEHKIATETAKWMIQFAKEIIEPYKPEWAERREIAKTLISLASAALIFTITFSSSIITPTTPRFWRYSVLVCWAAFICSLVCALGSLWFSMGLSSLPVLIDERSNAIADATRTAVKTAMESRLRLSAEDAAPVTAIFEEQLTKVAREDLAAYWLLRASLLCFGIALLILTIIGIRQLLH